MPEAVCIFSPMHLRVPKSVLTYAPICLLTYLKYYQTFTKKK